MSAADLTGWAIRRNGSCLVSVEVDCGATRAPFHACCPSSTQCPHQYNVACCPAGTNCTAAIIDTPRCANASWAMFDNAGHFCCEEGQVGYNLSNTDGCSRSGVGLPNGASPLAVVAVASSSSTISSTSTLTTPTTIPTTVPSPTPVSSTGGTSNAGAIAGGVVGGVALIAIILVCFWLIRRRRGRGDDATAGVGLPDARYSEKDATTTAPDRTEIDGSPRAELSNEPPPRMYELASS
ncbi:hypothetical protein F4677DRAFT_415029 [Hypoxylon crocopeplum]|nr:hypothetical protein F4677DRAFT_415029 [Hypoxylon crocopeplum]